MPFTFSHPAAVLPLTGIPKRYISVSALIIGSITPDFELFIHFNQVRTISHTWPGVFVFDLPLGLALLVIFNLLIRNTLIDHLPAFLNRRFSKFRRAAVFTLNIKSVVMIISSLLIGIVSHLIWDKLTHRTGALLEESWGNSFVWDANSVIGSVLITLFVWRLPQGKLTKKKSVIGFWFLLLLILGTYVFIYYPHAQTYVNLVIAAITGALIGLLVASIAVLIFSKKTSSPSY